MSTRCVVMAKIVTPRDGGGTRHKYVTWEVITDNPAEAIHKFKEKHDKFTLEPYNQKHHIYAVFQAGNNYMKLVWQAENFFVDDGAPYHNEDERS